MSNCKKLPYFEGLTDETIKQGSDFDPTEGVKAYDGYDEEIEYTYSPQELDTCLVGSQVIQYRASQTSEGDMLPNICIPDGLALALPSICDDYESTTAERIIHIIKANDPTIYGIPQVTVARGAAFDALDGVTAVDDNGNPITDITYSGTLDKEVSGDIISIDDGDERYPVKSLEVELEPIQDLNGYDKPWAGGAGKNLFDGQYPSISSSLRYRAIQVGNGTFTMSTTLPLDNGSANIFFLSGNVTSGASSGTNGVWANNPRTATAVDGYVTVAYRNLSGSIEYNPQNYHTQIEEGSTATSYEPYSNVCPISGRAEVVTQRTGKNLLDNNGLSDYTTWESLGSSNYAKPLNLPKDTQVTISGQHTVPSGMNSYVYLQRFDGTDWQNIRTLWQANVSSMPYTFTTDDSSYRLWAYNPSASIATIDWMQIEVGSTATSYEPYQGTTYTTTLGRTVYGGTLDVVSGELVVDRAMIVLDGTQAVQIANWRASENGVGWLYPYSVTNNAFSTSGIVIANIVSDKLQSQSYNSLYGQNVGIGLFAGTAYGIALWQGDTSLTTKEAINAYLAQNPITVVYELATPITIQLTPQQVMLLTGDNNLWSDGDVTMVYSVDIPTDGSVTYPLEGEYEITYSAEDKCGNIGTATRTIIVTAPTTNSLLTSASEETTEDNTESEVTE